jgi:hypothetical protein
MARRRGKGYRMDWKGRAVAAKVKRAAVLGINETMAEAVIYAKFNHPGWKNRTATAEGSIRIQAFAAVQGAHIVGRWGSTGVEYMRGLEFLHGSALRNSADVNYRSLQGHIQRRIS